MMQGGRSLGDRPGVATGLVRFVAVGVEIEMVMAMAMGMGRKGGR
jgi:hypothetical protein